MLIVYQIWTYGLVPGTSIKTPVIRDSTIYLYRSRAEEAQKMFDGYTYIVEYPVDRNV